MWETNEGCVCEFVELLAQLIFVLMTWVLCWDASVCPPYSSLHRALAPGSCFVWMHKWAFLPPGFWLGRMMGDIVSGSRKGRRERLGYFSSSLWDFCCIAASFYWRPLCPSSSPLCLGSADLCLPPLPVLGPLLLTLGACPLTWDFLTATCGL